jgi:hypothetical protein
MRYLRLALLPLLTAALVLGCDDPASAPAESPDLRAAQGDRSGWVLVVEISIPESEAPPFGFVECMKGGRGEETVNFGGPYGIYLKTVTAPSGNVISQGWIRTDYDAFRGLETGDLWVGPLNAKYREFTRAADGHLLLHEPISQILTNQRTGERVRIQFMVHLEFDELGNIVNKNFRYLDILSCQAMN